MESSTEWQINTLGQSYTYPFRFPSLTGSMASLEKSVNASFPFRMVIDSLFINFFLGQRFQEIVWNHRISELAKDERL